MKQVVVTGSFDNIRSNLVRFLQEASKLGALTVILWTDEEIFRLTGKKPKFPFAERMYVLQSIRYIQSVKTSVSRLRPDELPFADDVDPDIWVVDEGSDSDEKRLYCASFGIGYHVIRNVELLGWPDSMDSHVTPGENKKKVIVTGCYDWLHSGHIRFFEEASQYGSLYVAVGNDANLRLLKGAYHPQFPQDERRYMVQSIRYVYQALITSGSGWMDAEPEIALVQPDIYIVNEDGDKPEKRSFCQERGIEYVVLRRVPKQGLPRRESSDLRGF
jgi:cytidyltransferase-like protein